MTAVENITPKTILVIDDDKQFRDFLVELLGSKGYQVYAAENGKAGAVVFRNLTPDLVITDIVMPEQDGIGLLVEIKKNAPDLPVIAISGGNMGFGSSYLLMADKLGANAIMDKPFSPADLINNIQSLIH